MTGIDGFTVNYLRVFGNDMKTITQNALNSGGKTLSTSLRTAIVKLLRTGQKDPTAPHYQGTTDQSAYYPSSTDLEAAASPRGSSPLFSPSSDANRRPTSQKATLEAASSI